MKWTSAGGWQGIVTIWSYFLKIGKEASTEMIILLFYCESSILQEPWWLTDQLVEIWKLEFYSWNELLETERFKPREIFHCYKFSSVLNLNGQVLSFLIMSHYLSAFMETFVPVQVVMDTPNTRLTYGSFVLAPTSGLFPQEGLEHHYILIVGEWVSLFTATDINISLSPSGKHDTHLLHPVMRFSLTFWNNTNFFPQTL